MQVFDTTHHSEPRITQVKLQRHKILKINEEKHTYNHPSLQHLCKSLFYCARSNTSASVSISNWIWHVYIVFYFRLKIVLCEYNRIIFYQSCHWSQRKNHLTGFSLWSLKRAATKGQTIDDSIHSWLARSCTTTSQFVCICVRFCEHEHIPHFLSGMHDSENFRRRKGSILVIPRGITGTFSFFYMTRSFIFDGLFPPCKN